MQKVRKKRVKKALTPSQRKIAKLIGEPRGSVAQFARDISAIAGRR